MRRELGLLRQKIQVRMPAPPLPSCVPRASDKPQGPHAMVDTGNLTTDGALKSAVESHAACRPQAELGFSPGEEGRNGEQEGTEGPARPHEAEPGGTEGWTELSPVGLEPVCIGSCKPWGS